MSKAKGHKDILDTYVKYSRAHDFSKKQERKTARSTVSYHPTPERHGGIPNAGKGSGNSGGGGLTFVVFVTLVLIAFFSMK